MALHPWSRIDFTTREAYNAFVSSGGWAAFPEAVIMRVDIRCVKDVDVIGGSFMTNLAICAQTYSAVPIFYQR